MIGTPEKKTVTVKLTQFDLELVLMALGMLHNDKINRAHKTKPVEVVQEKLYRAAGVPKL